VEHQSTDSSVTLPCILKHLQESGDDMGKRIVTAPDNSKRALLVFFAVEVIVIIAILLVLKHANLIDNFGVCQ
jgi:hypothetical protein